MSLLLPQKTEANKEFTPHKEAAQHAAGRHQLALKLWLVHQSLRITEFRRRVTRRHAETPRYKGRRVCIAACVHSSSTDVVTFFHLICIRLKENYKGDVKAPTGFFFNFKLQYLDNTGCGKLIIIYKRYQLQNTYI